jgi:hypothetical protein
MSEIHEMPLSGRDKGSFAGEGSKGIGMSARSAVVNRTHRVVRERAEMLATRRRKARGLWLPMAICAAFLLIICTAVWNLMAQYETVPNGLPDEGNQFLVLLLWFLPVSMALLAVVLFRRSRRRADGEVAR